MSDPIPVSSSQTPPAPVTPSKILIACVFVAVCILFIFGKLSPCNTLRDSLRTEIAKNGGIAAALLPIMPETTLTRLTSISPDGLNPLQCAKLDISGETALPPVQSKLPPAAVMSQAGEAIGSAIRQCRDKRLDDTFKTHVESVQCSNTAITAAFTTAGYPYMDIVGQLTSKRLELAAQLDKDNLTEADEQLQLEDAMVQMVNAERAKAAK